MDHLQLKDVFNYKPPLPKRAWPRRTLSTDAHPLLPSIKTTAFDKDICPECGGKGMVTSTKKTGRTKYVLCTYC